MLCSVQERTPLSLFVAFDRVLGHVARAQLGPHYLIIIIIYVLKKKPYHMFFFVKQQSGLLAEEAILSQRIIKSITMHFF